MRAVGRGLAFAFAFAGMAATGSACAALSGLSDLQRDDCAFGCEGGADGVASDGVSGSSSGSKDAPADALLETTAPVETGSDSQPVDSPSPEAGAEGGCALSLCNGACVNETTDPNNCGACGHGCLGGLCSAGACQPVVLASGIDAPVGLALDSSFVYFTSPSGGTVSKVPVGGGNLVPIATGESSPTGIAVDAVNVYWSDATAGGNIMKAALPNGSPKPVATGLATPFWITTDGTNVYCSLGGANADVIQVPVTGGTPSNIATGQMFPYGMAIDANNVYWGSNSNTGVLKYPLLGGTASSVAGALDALQVATDGTYVYWTTYNSGGGVSRATPGGASEGTLVGGFAYPFGIAVDSTNVYFGTNNAVLRVPVGGGTATQIATDNAPEQLAVDATAVYWASKGNRAIMKLAK
jgi:hypothetical protein